MAGIDLLRWSQEGVLVKLHTSATDLLIDCYSTFCQAEISATIILAHALSLMQAELGKVRTLRRCSPGQDGDPGEGEPAHADAVNGSSNKRNFWLTLWTSSGPQSQRGDLRLAVSCLSWPLGDYPVFLWSPDAPRSTLEPELDGWLRTLQKALLDIVSPQRVFSVFGRTDLVMGFKRTWSLSTLLVEEPQPFYEALLTYCTRETIRSCNRHPLERGNIRLAELRDLDLVAVLCKEFADTSVYFPLNFEQGKQEARLLIEGKAVWLYEARERAVSICAVARQSDNVAVVTKVYTTPKWRRRGFAEALVRRVTEEMLAIKQYVALYVGTHNDAQRIYDRIGYVGLCEKDRPADVEDVLEIGFRGTNRGHW